MDAKRNAIEDTNRRRTPHRTGNHWFAVPAILARPLALVALGLALGHGAPLLAAVPAVETARLTALAELVTVGEAAAASDAAERLREAGPAGMTALLDRARECSGASCEALRANFDHVCGVRDCAEIGLYWYTDLEAARAAAAASGKPILSLRLMGRLDEEFSCANSRFFRTVFYKNAEIGALLRDRFVLHWRSVRPVPKVTIDFGDGTRLERTLTGNSIHYVLDSRGRLVDAIPGLYGPEAFLAALEDAEQEARMLATLGDRQAARVTAQRAARQLRSLGISLASERASLSPPAGLPDGRESAIDTGDQIATAYDFGAGERDLGSLEPTPVLAKPIDVGGSYTASKSGIEFPIADLLAIPVPDEELRRLAALRRPSIQLDLASRRFLLAKQGITDPLDGERLVDTFETTIALDEVINEYRYRPQLLSSLLEPSFHRGLDLETFNSWVYEEVFATPVSDPWLGLASEDVYTALPASGRTSASSGGQ